MDDVHGIVEVPRRRDDAVRSWCSGVRFELEELGDLALQMERRDNGLVARRGARVRKVDSVSATTHVGPSGDQRLDRGQERESKPFR